MINLSLAIALTSTSLLSGSGLVTNPLLQYYTSMGQSNAKVHHAAMEDGTSAGADAFEADMEVLMPGTTVKLINGAEGGSYASKIASERGSAPVGRLSDGVTWNLGIAPEDYTLVADVADPAGGTDADRLTLNTDNGRVGETFTGLTIGVDYRFEAFVRSPSGSQNIYLTLDGDSGTQYDFTLTDEWERIVIVFEATATSHSIFWDKRNSVAGTWTAPVEIYQQKFFQLYEWWWTDDTPDGIGEPGKECLDWLQAIDDEGVNRVDIKGGIWAQGESDSGQIPANYSITAYKAVLNSIFDWMKTKVGQHFKVTIQPLGKRGAGTPDGWQAITLAQQELGIERADTEVAGSVYNFDLFDNVHMIKTASVAVSKQNAAVAAAQQGASVTYGKGPAVSISAVVGNVVTLTVAHNGATGFDGGNGTRNPSGGQPFFTVLNSAGDPIDVTDVTVTNPNLIALTLDMIPGSNFTVYGGKDWDTGLDAAAVVKDNSTLTVALREFEASTTADWANIKDNLAVIDGYWDADDSVITTTTVGDEEEIDSVTDLSGNGNTAIPNASRDKLFLRTGVDGHNAFYGNGDFARFLEADHSATTTTPVQLITLAKGDSVGSAADPSTNSGINATMALGRSTAGDNSLVIYQSRTDGDAFGFVAYGVGSNFDTENTPDGWNVMSVGFDGTNGRAFCNLVEDGASPTTPVAEGSRVIESKVHLMAENPISSSRFGIGWMYAGLVLVGAISDAQLLEVQSSLAAKFGVSV